MTFCLGKDTSGNQHERIYKNVNAALAGQVSPDEALETADSEINKALATF